MKGTVMNAEREQGEGCVTKRRLSILAVMATAVTIVAWVVRPFGCVIHHPYSITKTFANITATLAFVALVTGAVAFERIIRSRGRLRGRIACVTSIIFAGLLCYSWLVRHRHPASIAIFSPVSSNLSRLGRAMLIYANDNDDELPDPNRWCDLLLEAGEVEAENLWAPKVAIRWPYWGAWPFGLGDWPPRDRPNLSTAKRSVMFWPRPRKGVSDFAMNMGCRTTSADPNTILLFESQPGWNQHGGPELLDFSRLDGKIACVLQVDTAPTVIRQGDQDKYNWGRSGGNK
jgi:hypothetical protein